ncbi:MAG: hypothetical protein H6767_03225 [Candidatus Peribacteria bacterium]|nr:MAG: hypothetical protein H6767_03225 [Candidatus Peribacteria bacterium]
MIVQSEFQDLFHHDDGEKTEQDVFSELTKKYPQDIVCFAQFLHGGGEFL